MTLPAHATGGFSCTSDDQNLSFSAESALGRGMGAPILNLQARADIKLKGVPQVLTKPDLSKALVHSWMAHPELRLHFYVETEGSVPFASLELIVMTTAKDGDDEMISDGTYRLQVFMAEPPPGLTEDGTLTAEGTVSCSVE